jgi:hypothetical protein
MLGTLNGALEAREIKLAPEDITADVEGVNEVRDGLPLLRRITVRYTRRIPAGRRETVDRAKCPTAASLAGAVVVEWEAEITEAPED